MNCKLKERAAKVRVTLTPHRQLVFDEYCSVPNPHLANRLADPLTNWDAVLDNWEKVREAKRRKWGTKSTTKESQDPFDRLQQIALENFRDSVIATVRQYEKLSERIDSTKAQVRQEWEAYGAELHKLANDIEALAK